MMKAKLFILFQFIFPQHFFSRLVGKLANSRNVWLKNKLIHLCIAHYKIDMSIVQDADLDHYPSFNAFFIRTLKKEVRPLDETQYSIVSPADGFISEIGMLARNRIVQAKGIDYTLEQLLANDKKLVAAFQQGAFATIYLSPRDYHRVHNPYQGILKRAIYVPGKLFSVNQTTVNHIPGVFARNERLIIELETDRGPMVVILVGAMLVAGIHTVFQGKITPNRLGTITSWDYSHEQRVFEKGAELGHFEFGSTAIVLFPEKKIEWLGYLTSGQAIQMGQKIGTSV